MVTVADVVWQTLEENIFTTSEEFCNKSVHVVVLLMIWLLRSVSGGSRLDIRLFYIVYPKCILL